MAHKDWAVRAPKTKLERMEAYFSGFGFEPHRHDTYAVGRTLAGVHSFRYRDGMKHSLPGGTIVIHPDELHDGEAGSSEGFHYRILYIEPALLQQALGGITLPFVPDGLSHDPRLFAATQTLMQGMDCKIDAALNIGFADQSHMARHFKKTYGISPARWLQMLR